MTQEILSQIFTIRGQKVMLDKDLAELYGVETKRLKEQVNRNLERFSKEFMIQLNIKDLMDLRSQNATSSLGWGGSRYKPLAFTEYGVVMAANVLKSEQAIKASILIVKAFVKLQGLVKEHDDIIKILSKHDKQIGDLKKIVDAYFNPPVPRKKIGF